MLSPNSFVPFNTDLVKSAKQGELSAMCQLAYLYYDGRTIKKDYSEAAKWFEKIINYIPDSELQYSYNEIKDAQLKAQYNLAECYFKQNQDNEAVICLEKLEQEDDSRKDIHLGEFSNVISWKERALEKLAYCYFEGRGVEKCPAKAAELLKELIVQLQTLIQPLKSHSSLSRISRNLAICYSTGKYLEKNYDEAAKYFALANAEIELGICHHYGYGNLEKNNELAINFFESALKENTSGISYLWLAYLEYLKNEAEIKAIFTRELSIFGYRNPNLTDKENEYIISNIFAKPSITDKEKYNIDKEEKRLDEIYKKISSIDGKISKAAYDLFITDNNFFNEKYVELIDFIFPEEIFKFLASSHTSSYKVVLAFYYICKNDKKKSLAILENAEANNDIFASRLLGLHYEKSKEFDESIKHFEKVKQNFSYKSCYEDNIKKECYDLADRKIELIEYKYKLEEIIQQKESLQNRMEKLVSNFTHNLGNFFPDIIYQVAERWKNNPECRKDVLLLHEAYHSEIIIKLQGELLRQRYTNNDPEKFRNFIRSCRRLPNNADNTKSIEDILDYAASRATARFLNQHYAGLNTIRDNILAKKGVDINALKQKFEDDILLNKSSRPIAWINENLRPIQIIEISPLWKKVCILAVSHAEALLFGYFSEILFNAFKYADHDKDEFLTLVFDESVINNKTYLACSWKNPVKDKIPLLGTGEGLDGIQEDLKQLNDTENPEQSLLVQQQNNQFQVTLFFNKDLLIDDLPILTRKRKMIEANHA